MLTQPNIGTKLIINIPKSDSSQCWLKLVQVAVQNLFRFALSNFQLFRDGNTNE